MQFKRKTVNPREELDPLSKIDELGVTNYI